MTVSLAFHLVGMIMWLGSLLIITRILRAFADAPSSSLGQPGEVLRSVISRAWAGFGIGGLLISLISGLYQISVKGFAYYMQQGWFHGKLTFIIILLVDSYLVHRNVAAVSKGGSVSRKTVGVLHGLAGLSLIVIVFMTMLGRQAGL